MARPTTDTKLRARVRELWLQRPPDKLTKNDVLAFYQWLEINRPKLLLKRGLGDPYQKLKVDLQDLIFGEGR
jgi:hypothetical protein